MDHHQLKNLKIINLKNKAKSRILKKTFQRLDKSITTKIKLVNNFNMETLFNKKYKMIIKVIIKNKQSITM